MWFERLLLREPEGVIDEALVGDTVFTGASVQWDALTRAERAWVVEQLRAARAAWFAAAPLPEATCWRLEGQRQGRDAALSLAWCGEDGAWRLAAPWGDLSADAQAQVRLHLRDALEAIYALLVIY